MTPEQSDPHPPPNNETFTAIITGISPISPLSQSIVSSLIKSLHSNSSNNDQRHISIALLGPDLIFLQQTISALSSPSNHTHASNQPDKTLPTLLPVECTLSSAESLGLAAHTIRATLGAWDIFIHNTNPHVSASEIHQSPATIRGSDADTWWGIFELNVHALHHIARHFFPKMKRGAIFVDVLPVAVPVPGVVVLRPSGDMSDGQNDERREMADGVGGTSVDDVKVRGRSAEHAAAVAAVTVVDHLAAEHVETGLECIKVAVEMTDEGAGNEYNIAERIVRLALRERM